MTPITAASKITTKKMAQLGKLDANTISKFITIAPY
jgi:hypothetical protein